MNQPWHLYLMAAVYIFAGLMHFIKPKMYLRIMPRYIPYPKPMVFWSGVAEIVLGIGICIPILKTVAVYGFMVMLLTFMLVHIYMLSGEKQGAGIPKWILTLRIPLQFVLIYWAYSYL